MKLEVEDGTVFGDPYYRVVDRHGLWSSDGQVQWRPMVDWCENSFGFRIEKGPGARWYLGQGSFWFKDKQDLTLFMLKWS